MKNVNFLLTNTMNCVERERERESSYRKGGYGKYALTSNTSFMRGGIC